MKAPSGRVLLPALCLLGTALFGALGIWQLERREWKLDLIDRVERGIAAKPIELPDRSAWDRLGPRSLEYRKVVTRGRFLHDRETLVDALTERGPGFWVMTPLRTTRQTILINRGFVPRERKARESRSDGQLAGDVTVAGLARLSEPDGRILRPNAPSEDRWYSRDVDAIARARGLGEVAPFFIDADGALNPGGYPIGGLTVVRFRNAHLAYAATWFAMALLCMVALLIAMREQRS